MQNVETESQNPFMKEYDCFVLAILSHGNRGVIYGIDTERVSSSLPAATKLGQGNVFTGVCDSGHGGLSASVHTGIPSPPRADTPQEQTSPQEQTPPQEACGRRVTGTHPTGMHSCL